MPSVTQDGLLTPQQLHEISADMAAPDKRKSLEGAKKAEEHKQAAHKVFTERVLRPDAMSYVMAGVKRAAEQGKNEFLVFQFPAEYLSDGGRRVNNQLPDWPDSLEGFAKRAYDFYEERLKSAGFHLRVHVLDFPNGHPGDVGFTITW